MANFFEKYIEDKTKNINSYEKQIGRELFENCTDTYDIILSKDKTENQKISFLYKILTDRSVLIEGVYIKTTIKNAHNYRIQENLMDKLEAIRFVMRDYLKNDSLDMW